MPNDIRITAAELRNRMSDSEEFTIIDARNPVAWAEASDMAAGANRVDLHSKKPLPEIPKDRPVVVYCT